MTTRRANFLLSKINNRIKQKDNAFADDMLNTKDMPQYENALSLKEQSLEQTKELQQNKKNQTEREERQNKEYKRQKERELFQRMLQRNRIRTRQREHH
ncbi:MAG: hypothetical protein IJ218_05855 [Alphaproteobacteria bacterium]|nr:hypothetical protein [Alphaproteobacteria bacterium]